MTLNRYNYDLKQVWNAKDNYHFEQICNAERQIMVNRCGSILFYIEWVCCCNFGLVSLMCYDPKKVNL